LSYLAFISIGFIAVVKIVFVAEVTVIVGDGGFTVVRR
jgi:hypothetical protein